MDASNGTSIQESKIDEERSKINGENMRLSVFAIRAYGCCLSRCGSTFYKGMDFGLFDTYCSLTDKPSIMTLLSYFRKEGGEVLARLTAK